MSKRVYEIARELDLDTKEVIGRLNEAGIEVRHHSASVEDPVYERVFGDGSSTQNGRSEAQEAPAEEPVAAPPRKK
jgi:translation initiation factor IF-2